jgi:hypothetical protein
MVEEGQEHFFPRPVTLSLRPGVWAKPESRRGGEALGSWEGRLFSEEQQLEQRCRDGNTRGQYKGPWTMWVEKGKGETLVVDGDAAGTDHKGPNVS